MRRALILNVLNLLILSSREAIAAEDAETLRCLLARSDAVIVGSVVMVTGSAAELANVKVSEVLAGRRELGQEIAIEIPSLSPDDERQALLKAGQWVIVFLRQAPPPYAERDGRRVVPPYPLAERFFSIQPFSVELARAIKGLGGQPSADSGRASAAGEDGVLRCLLKRAALVVSGTLIEPISISLELRQSYFAWVNVSAVLAGSSEIGPKIRICTPSLSQEEASAALMKDGKRVILFLSQAPPPYVDEQGRRVIKAYPLVERFFSVQPFTADLERAVKQAAAP